MNRPLAVLVALLALLLVSISSATVADAQGPASEDASAVSYPRRHLAPLRIPEPLFNDLARELGVRRGALDASATFGAWLDDARPLAWGGEIQGAPLDGLGLELDLDFQDASLAFVEAAAQWTIGRVGDDFIHGLLVSGASAPDGSSAPLQLTWLPAYRFDRTFSLQAGLGWAYDVGSGPMPYGRNTFVVTNAIFVELGDTFVLALEADASVPIGDTAGWQALVLPQVEWILGRASLQVGVGMARDAGGVHPVFAASVGIER